MPPTTESRTGREVQLPADGSVQAMPAYAALPQGARRGVVVIHEIFGRQPEIDRVVEKFAARGYAAVAPDLFADGTFRCIRQTMQALKEGTGPSVERADRVRRWLMEEAGIARERIGIIGFCFGGGFALGVGRGWGAVSTNYGQIPTRAEVLRGMGPTIGCYGKRDRVFGAMGPVLEERLGAVGVEVESHTFASVGHSFLTDGNHPVSAFLSRPLFSSVHDPAVAAEAWGHIFSFFEKHLGAPGA